MTSKELAENIFKSKERYHKSMAKLPIEEKVKMVIELQKAIAATAKYRKNVTWRDYVVWGTDWLSSKEICSLQATKKVIQS